MKKVKLTKESFNIKKIENIKLSDIKPYAKNPRKNEQAIEPVINSIKRVGYRTPITIDEKFIILTGHTRYEALKNMGYTEIPFVIQFLDMTEKQKKEYRVLDNKTNEIAEWDFDILKDNFDIDTLKDFGFDTSFYNDIMDFSESNKEINTDAMSDEMKITLTYPSKKYFKVIEQLEKINADQSLAVWKLLGNK